MQNYDIIVTPLPRPWSRPPKKSARNLLAVWILSRFFYLPPETMMSKKRSAARPGDRAAREEKQTQTQSIAIDCITSPFVLQQSDYSPLSELAAKMAEAEAGMEAAIDDPTWIEFFQIWLDCHRKITASKNRFIHAHEQAQTATVTGSQVRALIRLRARIGQTEFRKARAAVGVKTGITRMSKNEARRLIGKIKRNLQGGETP